MEQQIKPNGNWKLYLGYAIAIIYLIVGISEIGASKDAADAVAAVFATAILVGLGALLINSGNKTKREMYYTNLIYLKRVGSIDEIAKISSHSIENIKKDLAKLNTKGKLAGVDVNFSTNQITYDSSLAKPPEPPVKEPSVERKVLENPMTCTNCGAIYSYEVSKCEYCGGKDFSDETGNISPAPFIQKEAEPARPIKRIKL